jgi:hypothetical protein
LPSLAATNKCLAQSNKSQTGGKVTKKCPDGSRRIDETGRLRRDRSSVQNGEFGPVGRQCDIQNCVEREVSKPLADDSKTLPTPTSTPALKTGGTAPTRNNEGDCDLRQDLDPDQHGSSSHCCYSTIQRRKATNVNSGNGLLRTSAGRRRHQRGLLFSKQYGGDGHELAASWPVRRTCASAGTVTR